MIGVKNSTMSNMTGAGNHTNITGGGNKTSSNMSVNGNYTNTIDKGNTPYYFIDPKDHGICFEKNITKAELSLVKYYNGTKGTCISKGYIILDKKDNFRSVEGPIELYRFLKPNTTNGSDHSQNN